MTPKVLLPLAFAAVMVGAAAQDARGWEFAPAAVALTAVCAGIWWRPAATAAVAATIGTVVAVAPAPLYATLAGLAATAYLLTRHRAGTLLSTVAAVGCSAVVALAVALPWDLTDGLPWVPLAAPLLLLAAYLLALHPYVR